MEHPGLFLPVYDEWIADLIRRKEIPAACKLFEDKVVGLYYAKGDFVPESFVRTEVNRLHKAVKAKEEDEIYTAPTLAEKTCALLFDYLDLYFPDLTEHSRACKGYNHLWRFAKRLGRPKKQKHPNFSCLACGAVFKSCSISKMRSHLNGEGGKICLKLTANISNRFKDGESENKYQNQGVLYEGGYGKSIGQPKQSEEGRMVKPNPPVAEHTGNIYSMADAVHTSVQSLHAAAVGKTLDPDVAAILKSAKEMLDEIVP